MTRPHVRPAAAALAALMLLAACARGGSNAADTAGQGAFVESAVAVAGSDTIATPAPTDTTLAPPEKTDARPGPAHGDGAPAVTAPPAAGRDTLRGIVAEVGSMPMTSIVIRPAGGRSVTITGDLAREIGRAAGAEVWVSGTRTERGIEAVRYAIRSVDGQPAVDGTLARDGDRLVLVNESGRHVIARPPAGLRDRVGARVFLVGSLDGSITSYGILREER